MVETVVFPICSEPGCWRRATDACSLCSADLCNAHAERASLYTRTAWRTPPRTETLCASCAQLTTIAYQPSGSSTLLPVPLVETAPTEEPPPPPPRARRPLPPDIAVGT